MLDPLNVRIYGLNERKPKLNVRKTGYYPQAIM